MWTCNLLSITEMGDWVDIKIYEEADYWLQMCHDVLYKGWMNTCREPID